jgi:hypothetical protein
LQDDLGVDKVLRDGACPVVDVAHSVPGQKGRVGKPRISHLIRVHAKLRKNLNDANESSNNANNKKLPLAKHTPAPQMREEY